MQELKRLISYALILSGLLLLVFTAFRGIFFPDEGYILVTAQRMLEGQILYKDFDFVYTPLTPVSTYLSFLLFGNSIFAERVMALILSVLTSYALYRIGKLLTRNPLLQLVPALIYIAWGPSHINFIWPGMWAVNFGIIAFCLLYEALVKKDTRLYLFSGIAIACILLTKQNFAVAALLNLFVLLLIIKPFRQWKQIKPFLLGFGLTLGITTLYFLLTDSLLLFLENSYFHIIRQILIEKTLDTPLFVGGNILSAIVKYLFYFSPLIFAIIALPIIWKNEKPKIILVSFVGIFFLFGFRPVTDYVHLVPLLSMTGLSLLVLILSLRATKESAPLLRGSPSGRKYSWGAAISYNNFFPRNIYKGLLRSLSLPRNDKYILATILIILNSYFIILTLVGVWSALFFGYYRFSPPLASPHEYLSSARGGIWIDTEQAKITENLRSVVQKYSDKNDEIFLNYYSPMIYFLTEKRNPTRHDYPHLPNEQQKEIVQDLMKSNIRVIIASPRYPNDTGPSGVYIRKYYEKKEKIGEYQIWVRKE